MVLLTHRASNFDIHAVKPHFLPQCFNIDTKNANKEKNEAHPGPWKICACYCIFEFSIIYTKFATLAMTIYVEKSKINSTKKLPPAGIETSCDPP